MHCGIKIHFLHHISCVLYRQYVFDRSSSSVTLLTIATTVSTVSVFGLEFWGHLLQTLGTQNTLISPQLEHGVGWSSIQSCICNCTESVTRMSVVNCTQSVQATTSVTASSDYSDSGLIESLLNTAIAAMRLRMQAFQAILPKLQF